MILITLIYVCALIIEPAKCYLHKLDHISETFHFGLNKAQHSHCVGINHAHGDASLHVAGIGVIAESLAFENSIEDLNIHVYTSESKCLHLGKKS